MLKMLVSPDIPPEIDDICRSRALVLVVSRMDNTIKVVKVVQRSKVAELAATLEHQYPALSHDIVMATITPYALCGGSTTAENDKDAEDIIKRGLGFTMTKSGGNA